MAIQRFVNNAGLTLTQSLAPADTTIQVDNSAGLIPALTNGDWVVGTLVNVAVTPLTYEIVQINAATATTLTVVRAQEGTTAQAFPTAAAIQILVTEGGFFNAVAFVQNGGGSTRSMLNKAQEFVTPQDFMTLAQINNVYLGLGTIDVTAAVLQAFTLKKSVHAPSGSYLVTSPVVATLNIDFFGDGYSSLFIFKDNATSGPYDCFTTATNGGNGGGIRDIKFDCSGMSGGRARVVDHSTKVVDRNFRVVNGFDGCYLRQINSHSMHDCIYENFRGTGPLLFCDGTTQRSDGLFMTNVQLIGNGSSNQPGMVVDGFFNTICFTKLLTLRVGRGILHTNSVPSQTPGSFFRYIDHESDVSTVNEHIRLEFGSDFHYVAPYCQGSIQADGAFFDTPVDLVSIFGGRITGNALHGVNTNASRVTVHGTALGGNSQGSGLSGQYSGVYCGPTSKDFNAFGCVAGLNVSQVPSQKWSLEIDPAATGTVWIGGDLTGSITGEWTGPIGNCIVKDYTGGSPSTDKVYTTNTAASGGTFAAVTGVPLLILTGSGTIATYSVTMPVMKDGDIFEIANEMAITAFTLVPNGSQALINAPTTLAVNQGVRMKKIHSTSVYRLGS